MKRKLTFLLLPLFLACSSNSERTSTEPEIEANSQTAELPTESQLASKQFDWEDYQDSLRTELLNSKPNNFLKGSLIEELYIRNVVTLSEDSIYFEIPFNLHGFDCGAPDCYSTDMKFGFPHENKLEFPNRIVYSIHEHGCVDTESRLTSDMILLNQNNRFISYYSPEQRGNLIIIGNDKRKEYVYYFLDVEQDSIKADQISKLLLNLPDTASAPYRSTQLLTLEYENFMNK